MAKFNRKVERQKKEYTFTKKEEIIETNTDILKESITFLWIPRKIMSVGIIFLIFAFVSFTVIPLLIQWLPIIFAMAIGHGLITSSLLVAVFYILDKNPQKPSLKILFIRFGVVAILLLLFVFVSMMVL